MDRVFGSRQKWSVHAFKTHSHVKEVRRLVGGQQCPVCLRQHSCNVALCNHLEYAFRCRSKLIRASFRCGPTPGVGSRACDKGDSFLGATKQAFGPADPNVVECTEPLPAWQPARQFAEQLLAFLASNCSRACDALELLRSALASTCIAPAEVHCAVDWCMAWLEEHEDDLSVSGACLARRALNWVREHWTPQWICGQGTTPVDRTALFRNSELLLLDADFCSELLPAEPNLPTRDGMLICAELERYMLEPTHFGWSKVLLLEQLLADGSRIDEVHRCAVLTEGSGLTAVSLASIGEFRPPTEGLLAYRDFSARKVHENLMQDVYLLAVQLWHTEKPFAFLLPLCDPAISALARRLPGVQCRCVGRFQLLFNCQADAVPLGLFHLQIRCLNTG